MCQISQRVCLQWAKATRECRWHRLLCMFICNMYVCRFILLEGMKPTALEEEKVESEVCLVLKKVPFVHFVHAMLPFRPAISKHWEWKRLRFSFRIQKSNLLGYCCPENCSEQMHVNEMVWRLASLFASIVCVYLPDLAKGVIILPTFFSGDNYFLT